jgi:predicted helicase
VPRDRPRKSSFQPGEDRVEAVAKLLSGFFSSAPEGIGRAQQLALALATRSRLLRDYLGEELVRQEREHKEGRLYGLFQVFRDQVFHELTLKEFADALAQMLAYGLFLARLNSDLQPITLHNAREYVPGSFRLIRELVDFLNELEKDEYRDVRWVVEEVLSIVNGLDLPAIHADLSFRHRKAISRKVRAADEEEHRLFERDPFIYFYEDYLRAYDKETSKARGVYYTPPPIVNFIVRAVDDVLKDSFGIPEGLADYKRVTVLDFACGTGTFLLEVFQKIFDTIGGPESGLADLIVRDHFLENIFGFEYLIAPYTIAHLKLSQYLKDQGHPLKNDERLRVFLTNTLEPIEPQKNLLLPAVTSEVEGAQAVKDREILVITGNPPYAGHSKNPSERVIEETVRERRTKKGVIRLSRPRIVRRTIKTAIGALIEDYKICDGKPLGEKNPKWLHDDYVKFIRFAQSKMDAVEEGVVGVITNHSWLDNPTFRGMRQSLMQSFERIYILDLHGSSKRKERAPDGSKDENVFDIEQGVAIIVFVKRLGLERGLWRGDLWGRRLAKYRAVADGTLKNVDWLTLTPAAPFYLFTRSNAALRKKYDTGWSVTEVFPVNVLGFQTHRDAFAVSFTEFEMKQKLKELADVNISDGELARRYGLKSNSSWSFPDVRSAARKGAATSPQLVAYRPFDNRWAEFSGLTMDRPRRELLDHVAGKENLCLLVPRQIGISDWRHVLVATIPTESCLVSSDTKSQNYVLPMYIFGTTKERQENLSKNFRAFIDSQYDHHHTSEEILGYIYAILHAPTYRTRYVESLRVDFPRVPFPESPDHFERLSELGWELVQAHLLRQLPRKGLANYHGKGDHTVEAVRYSPQEQAISINQAQSFKPVPPAVWDFHIGGYQVVDKYLKSRKGRQLSLDEINHVAAVADSLGFTIDQMVKIETAYKAAFPEQE